ncbi:glycosyltransferase family 4 protein [Nocardia sp. NPDC051570]|uniref:glycosyltransferase family 4 protein n=1 Tax=Nocardia sp. NPDC051570 TaxID=3364324 RepID=UPI0037A35092
MIVHITDVFAPRIGGIEVQIDSLACTQTASGEQVHVVTATGGADGDGGLPYRVHRLTRGESLRALLLRLRPRVAHVHLSVYSPFALSSVREAHRLHIPTVVTVHSMWDAPVRTGYRMFGGRGDWQQRAVLTAVSTAVAAQVDRALPKASTVVVPNAVSPTLWHSVSRQADDLHVVSVGRLAARRQPLTLLKVLRLAHLRLAGEVALRATVVGTGPWREAMYRYLRRHDMTWVRLAGAQDQHTIGEILATADVYLNVTRREAFGLATLEARTAGLPVIARSGTGVTDFVEHGREGLLGNTTQDLVTALVSLGRHGHLRHRITTHNRTVTPTAYCWPAVLNRLHDCYDDAVRRAAPPDARRPTPSGKSHTTKETA